MPLTFRLDDYQSYRERVGQATYVDLSRRTDPARIPAVWENLRALVAAYGPPWVAQVWTKDAAGVIRLGGEALHALRPTTTLTAQLTVTGLGGSIWEPLVPPDGFDAAPRLAELLGGPEHIRWRYDPIIPTVHSPERFARLAAQAARLGIGQGVINFVAPPGRYARVDARLAAHLPGWAEGMPGYDAAWRADAARALVRIAAEAGLVLSCCAESAGLAAQVPGLGPAACGDHAWFVALAGHDPGRPRRRGSRPGCGCAPYFDVGSYGHWARCHRCAYCYAG
ncbi:MAG: DUF1848 family protein [Chloroflexota bacterium]